MGFGCDEGQPRGIMGSLGFTKPPGGQKNTAVLEVTSLWIPAVNWWLILD